MKKIYLFSILTLLSVCVFAQNSGKGFAYQAVARDAQGDILTSQNIEIRFSLMPGQHAATPSWQETHVATTDAFGTFSVTIGKGIKVTGTVATYADVDFSSAAYWLKVEIKEDGTFEEISYAALGSVPYAEVANNAQACPVGTIIAFAGDTSKIPDGWELCDGEAVPRTGKYAALYAVIGTAWGYGDNSTTFDLPDLRGMFLRGVSLESNNDPNKGIRQASSTGGNTGNNVGSWQNYELTSHNHDVSDGTNDGYLHGNTTTTGGHGHDILYDTRGNDQGSGGGYSFMEQASAWASGRTRGGEHNHSIRTYIPSVGGNETRPRNAYVNYIIKY
jgi:microcystin-dependent protein